MGRLLILLAVAVVAVVIAISACEPAAVSQQPQQPANSECAADSDCGVGGCSGQLCIAHDKAAGLATTCEYREEYGCYQKASCGCVSGKCEWKPTPELQACLDRAKDGMIQADTSTVEPGDPTAGLTSYPDLPLTSVPDEAVTVKFLIEHRSALDGKTVKVRGVVVGTLLGEAACPSRGMCANPRIYLSDMSAENRDKAYDLTVLVNEGEQKGAYPVGIFREIQGIVAGSKSGVVIRKVYSPQTQAGIPDESKYCVDSMGKQKALGSCSTVEIEARKCSNIGDCVATCGFGCVNKNWMRDDKADCEAVIQYECECLDSFCQVK